MNCKLPLLLPLFLLVPGLRAEFSFKVYTWPLQGLVSESSDIARLPELYYLDKQDQPRRLRIARGSVTRSHRYDGPSPLRLVIKEEQASGEDRFRAFARVPIQTQTENTLLIYNPDQPLGNGQPNVAAMNVDPRKVPDGKATLYNSSRRTVLLQVDGRNVQLQPGKGLIQAPGSEGEAFSRMRVRVAATKEGQEAKIMFSGSIRIFKEEPNLFLIQEYGDRYQVRSLRGLTRDS